MAKRIYQRRTKILSNIHLSNSYYKLAFDSPETARIAQPGQFVMLRVSENYQPLLRRPFSIHSIKSQIEILYQVVGKGTQLLSGKKPGQYIDVLGPLGNGFSILDSRYSLLVGGGIGIAPLLFLAEQLLRLNYQSPTVLIGAKTNKEILSQKGFASLGCSVRISTNDGSVGFKGKVTELVKCLLSTINHRRSIIYACGPKPMLREISIISRQYNIPAQISLDEYMACGLGVCLGCMIETREGQKLVCRDGPVFDSSILRLNQ